jgi:predicted dehydrogenase
VPSPSSERATPRERTKKRTSSASAGSHKVRYAVVGLGYIAQIAVLPAFAKAKNSELVALVSDDPKKLAKLGNAARYIFQAEPVEVFAWSANNGEKRFEEVDEMSSAILRFPDERLASFTSSFGASNVSRHTR